MLRATMDISAHAISLTSRPRPFLTSACRRRSLFAVGHFCSFVSANVAHPDWTIFAPVAITGAFIIWIIGRAVRYLLAGL